MEVGGLRPDCKFANAKVPLLFSCTIIFTLLIVATLSSDKPAPTVPSNQSFYQSLWDALDRSNRPLERANKASITLQPTKKVKASLPDAPNTPSLSPPPPESFEEANRMVQEAWKVAFPSLIFPLELIVGFPSRKSQVVAAPHEASLQH